MATEDSVLEASQQLLTFRSIAGETFDRTLVAAQDLAAVGFGSVQSAAVQLGKALEDPEQGLSALRRVGVSFSASQRELISTLVDTGRTLEAQQVILRAVEQQVGGAGAAQASGLTGATHRLSEAWEDLLTNIGNTGPWQAAANYLTGMVDDINTALNPSLESATAHLAELQRQKEAATFMGVDITFGELDAAIATTQETIQQLTVLNRAKEQQGQFAAESAAQIQLETAAEQQHTAELQRKGAALGELAGQLEEEKVQRDRLSAQATAAAEQRAAEAQQRSAAVRDIQIEAAQQQRLAAAWREGADAAREVEIAIEAENAVRRIGLDVKSAEAQAVALAIKQSADAQASTDAETAAIQRRTAELQKMLAGPVGQASTEDIRRDPSQSRQSQQQAEETAASWQVRDPGRGRPLPDGRRLRCRGRPGHRRADDQRHPLRRELRGRRQVDPPLVDRDHGADPDHDRGGHGDAGRVQRHLAWPAAGSQAVRPPGLLRPARKGSPASWASVPWLRLHLLLPPLLRPAVPCSRRCRAVRELRAAAWSA